MGTPCQVTVVTKRTHDHDVFASHDWEVNKTAKTIRESGGTEIRLGNTWVDDFSKAMVTTITYIR